MRSIIEIKKMYEKFFTADGISKNEITKKEEELGITLPNDFKEITSFFSGGSIGPIEIYDFCYENELNIWKETERIRKAVDLELECIVLAEPPESIIIMHTEKKPAIIWCDASDIYNIKTGKFDVEPEIWENFSDFFYDILMEEVELRDEE